jgi:hypothetical protein
MGGMKWLDFVCLLQFRFTLQRIEHGGADHQICQRANNQGKGAHILALHFASNGIGSRGKMT